MPSENDKLRALMLEYFETMEEKKRLIDAKYPNDVPNEVCNHALIYGMSVENSFSPKVGEFNHLFSTKYEDIYVWTYKKNTNSALVSVVNPIVKTVPFWKTAGRLIQLAFLYVEAFETPMKPVDYKWMYYFDFDNTDIDTVVFYGLTEIESHCLSNGRIHKATDIADLADIIELLIRDDCAFNAVSLVKSAFDIHWCCLTCETSSHPYHDHLSEEPQLWNQADVLQSMEISIVQSCRAVESIIGEPPNKSKKNALLRHKEKWMEATGINPDDCYEKAQKSYLDYYYDLFFDLRNPSAHSYGNIHYDLQRKKAVEAQCFAAIVLREYINKKLLDIDVAKEKLHFNQDFLSKVSEDWSTKMTKE